jgi:sortase A
MIGKTFYQPAREEVKYFINTQINKKYIVADTHEAANIKKEFGNGTSKGGLAKALNLQDVEVLVPEDPNFSIVIPKIGANARIIDNVDPSNESEYLEALKKGVAHAQGTAFPGENSHIFLFAHSTDYIWNVGTYNAVFYLLYKLDKGDEVNLFYKDKRYRYKVVDKKVVDPSQVEYLTRKTNHEFLTLQTCWPPGTTLKRILVFATRVAE